MNQWMIGCSRLYRRLARAFPHEFRMVCGDGLEQLGADFVPLIWREQGVLGLVRCFSLPCASLSYVATGIRIRDFARSIRFYRE